MSPLKDLDIDFIVSVDLNATYSGKSPGSIVEVLINAFNFMMHTASALRTRKADLRIEPDLSSFNAVDMNQVPDLIEAGY